MWINYLLLIHSFNLNLSTNNQSEKCINHLMHYTRGKANYQVLLLSSIERQDTVLEDLLRKTLKNIPSIRTDLSKISDDRKRVLNELSAFEQPRETTFFIITGSSADNSYPSKISDTLDFLRRLSPVRSRPKCLFIFLTRKKSNYEEFLRRMWFARFLDVTVLQLRELNINNATSQIKATLHYLNPFTNKYASKKCTSKSKWFPNKLRDMNGHPLKIGIGESVRNNHVVLNRKNGNPDILMLKTWIKMMNFSVSLVPQDKEGIGIYNSINKSCTGMLGKLERNEVNVFLVTLVLALPSNDLLFEYTIPIEMQSLFAITPILPGEVKVLTANTLYATILIFVFSCGLVWAASRLLKFQPRIWDPINIVQVFLGMSITQLPSAIPEIVLFSSIMSLSLFYSTNFFAGLTSMKTVGILEIEINSLEDLDKSGLRLMIHPNFIPLTFSSADTTLLNLRNKTSSDANVNKICLKQLMTHKNISCLMSTTFPALLTDSMRNSSGNPIAKLMKETFWTTTGRIALERGSPYKERMDELIFRIRQSGLRNEWALRYSWGKSSTNNNMEKESSKIEEAGGVTHLRRRLIFIAIHGYTLSIVIFVGEVLLHQCRRMMEKLIKLH